MARAVVLFRLIVRPMAADPVRALLTVAAVALGVAVIVAVDLASEASMGSFRSSLESLEGSASYEITQVGGIPETVYGDLVRLPEPLAFSPRIEGFALLPETGEQVPLFGVDLVGDAMPGTAGAMPRPDVSELIEGPPVWVGASLGVSPGDALELIAGDRRLVLEVRGVLDPLRTAAGRFVVMDIALAQRLLGRMGRLDRIYVYTRGEERDWRVVLAPFLPPRGLHPAGRHRHRGRPPDAQRVPLESPHDELRHDPGGRLPHLQHHQRLHRPPAPADRHRAGGGGVAGDGAGGVPVRGGRLRRPRGRGRPRAGAAARDRRGRYGRADRQLALREQHAGGESRCAPGPS